MRESPASAVNARAGHANDKEQITNLMKSSRRAAHANAQALNPWKHQRHSAVERSPGARGSQAAGDVNEGAPHTENHER